jgi:hypothetical protein
MVQGICRGFKLSEEDAVKDEEGISREATTMSAMPHGTRVFIQRGAGINSPSFLNDFTVFWRNILNPGRRRGSKTSGGRKKFREKSLGIKVA